MNITFADFDSDIEKYVDLAAEQDIFIIRDGKCIAKLTRIEETRE